MTVFNGVARRLAGAQHRDLHEHNLSLVLGALRLEPTSRTTLARRSGLTLTTIGRLATTLIELGLVSATEPAGNGRPGRPAASLQLSNSVMCYGVDVTADDVTVVELTLGGQLRLLERTRVPHAPSPDAVADIVGSLISAAAQEAVRVGNRPVGVGLAVPALVNHLEQTVRVSASLGWQDVPLAMMVGDRLTPRLSVVMESRAKSHALAQADQVPGARLGTLVHLEVDQTIGAGLVVNGESRWGSRGYAGNVGHVPLDPTGPTCECGNTGCLEALAGLRHLAQLAGLDMSVPADATAPPRDVLLDELVSRARQGDTRTLEALRVVGYWLGVGCVNVLHTLDPDVITIGGYPPRLRTWLLPHVERAIAQLAQDDYAAAHELIMVPDKTGVAKGAATMPLRELLDHPLKIAEIDQQ